MKETKSNGPEDTEPQAGTELTADNASPAPVEAVRVPKGGDAIYRQHSRFGFVHARIDRVHDDGSTVDLTCFDPRDNGSRITSSPYDPTGKKPDSWRFADPD